MEYLTVEQKEALKAHKALLDEQPPYHEPATDGDYLFIPIGYLESDLDMVFPYWGFEIIQIQELNTSVTATVRISVMHPVFGHVVNYDGAATIAFEQGEYKGSTGIIKPGEEHKYVSVALAKAEQNAARRIGNRFGRNLNRDIAPGKERKAPEPIDPSTITCEIELLKALSNRQITKEQADEIRAVGYEANKKAKAAKEEDTDPEVLKQPLYKPKTVAGKKVQKEPESKPAKTPRKGGKK